MSHTLFDMKRFSGDDVWNLFVYFSKVEQRKLAS